MAVTTMTIQMSFVPIIQCKFGQIHLRTKNHYHVIPGRKKILEFHICDELTVIKEQIELSAEREA